MSVTPTAPSRPKLDRRRWALALALGLHLVSGGWLLSSKGIGQYFYDERFTLENVRRIALQGHPVPTSYFWYAPLSYLPQASTLLALDRIGELTGSDALDTLRPTGEPTRLGILVARSFGILFGCLTLIALHAIVRRLWDERSADFAVVALGASPWFTRGNAEFKPDALLVLLCVAVFLPLTRAVLDASSGGRRIAAVLAGAAAAAKLNGVLVVVPLGLAALLALTWRQRLVATLESAAITVVSFLLLNPWPASALHYLRKVDSQWEMRAQDLGFLGMLGTMSGKLFKSTYLGPLLATAAVAGLLLVLRGLVRRDGDLRRRVASGLWVLYPTVYLLFLCASTRYPKENNLLPVLPFAAALAGVGMASLRARLAPAAPRLAPLLLPALALAGGWNLLQYVVVETTEQLADTQVRDVRREIGGGYGRVVAWAGGDDAMREFANSGWNGPPPLLLPLDAQLLDDSARFDRVDCAGGYGAPPANLADRLSETLRIRRYGRGLLAARLFQRTARPWHGCRPWRQVGAPLDLAFERHADGWLEARLPDPLPDYDAFTLNGRARIQSGPLAVEIGGQPFTPQAIGSARQRWVLIGSERTVGELRGATVRVRPESDLDPKLEIVLWAAPDPAAETSAPSSAPVDVGESG